MLEVKNLSVRYAAIRAINDVSLTVARGEIVTLIGCNGAGKTTILRALSGLLRPESGSIMLEGEKIHDLPAHKILQRKLAHVPEGRQIFSNLSVEENLRMGAYSMASRSAIQSAFEEVFELFPRLKERRSQSAGTLSGGEQQMLAIGRALMSHPKLLLLDEPSLGIAPILVSAIFERITEINRTRDTTILLVEQNARLALEISSRAYVLEAGAIVASGDAADLRDDPSVKAAYLGG